MKINTSLFKYMKIDDLIKYGISLGYKDEALMILSSIYNVNKIEVLTIKNQEVSINEKHEFLEKIDLLKMGKPIQYILGNVNFCGINLIVNENVLIPRFETEELVDKVYNYIINNFKEKIKVLDLCTGSGAIGLALKSKIPLLDVTLSDISEAALSIASLNAKNLNLDVKIVKSDLLEDINDKFDIIISNPPYIMIDEEIEEIVKNNEPHLALYAGIDGLDCYRRILSNVRKNLKDEFLIALEIGYSQKEKIFKLAKDNLGEVNLICKKDLSGNDRMIFVSNKDIFSIQ